MRFSSVYKSFAQLSDFFKPDLFIAADCARVERIYIQRYVVQIQNRKTIID